MGEEEGVVHNFYPGLDYGLDPEHGSETEYSENFSPSTPAGSFGVTIDPRTANQLKGVSDKLNTGAKTIEVQGLTPEVFESIPKQHFKEINRLKKLAGVDLTFHGPLVEPTGVTGQGWDESHRQQSEVQMMSAIKMAHDLEPDGNIIITFHSSNGLPEPEKKIFNPITKKEEIKDFWVVDERTGHFTAFPIKPDYFKSEDKQKEESMEGQYLKLKKTLSEQNKDSWFKALQGVSYHASHGNEIIKRAIIPEIEAENKETAEIMKKLIKEKNFSKSYKKFLEGEGEKSLQEVEQKHGPEIKSIFNQTIQRMYEGDLYLRDSYQDLKKLFNQAYDSAKREDNKKDLKKLDEFRTEIEPHLKDIEDPDKIDEFADQITKGAQLLRSIEIPQTLKPLRDFAVDKAAETFSNLALSSYEKFKDSAPIISVENPPSGMGLSRSEDLRQLMEKSREKFVQKAQAKGMSKSEAEKQAEKLIGVTWDVGHINMMRKYGYDKDQVVKETERVAPYVKHIHLSDNFGMEHTELPMGMGNVPLKEHLAELQKNYGDKLKKIKKIVEAGNWYQHFQTTPFKETLSAFNSPVYAMEMGPHWGRTAGTSEGYFIGQGPILPEQHFNLYGAGFLTLPLELGGQMGGKSRVSGAPIE